MPESDDIHAPCHRNLEIILGVARRLAYEPRLDPLLRSIAEETCNLLDAERATLFLYDATADELYSRIVTKSEIEVIRFPAGRGIAGAVARQKACLVIPDAYADPRFNPEVDRNTGWRTRNMLAVPMTNLEGRLVGVLEALNKRAGPFSETDMSLLTALAAQAGVALERARLLEEFLAKRRLENEMELARDIQAGLLPQSPPRPPGLDLAGWSRPSEYAGGDFFDLFEWGPDRVGMMLGDAVGHGVGPALLAAETRALVRALALREERPDEVLAGANRLLANDVTDGRFVTLALAAVEARTGAAAYASAGQGPLLVLRASGEAVQLPSTGLPLGILPDASFDSPPAIQLAAGDALVLISDGIFECDTREGKELGIEAVIDAARSHLPAGAAVMLKALEDLTDRASPNGKFRDDRTAVAARRVE
ncbi:MAG: GAF domain-containing protein [Planctomycetes bacterium]|nr:GAF domain-containing protein [Planctomycetota bacterium]